MDKILVATLSDGGFHSGQVLGELLGVSRTAVWKHLQKLAELGIDVESVKGKGYRIPGGLELLRLSAIQDRLNPQVQGLLKDIVLHQSVNSTNHVIASLEEKGAGMACFAEHQQAGRGRRGRSWTSPFGKNIYLSLGWQFEGGAAELEGLSLAVGVAVIRALNRDERLGLKWPNDIYFDGRKLAGILLEMYGDASGRCQVVVGIGINHGMTGEGRDEINQPWADVSELGSWHRNDLAASVLNELLPVVASFSAKKFVSYQNEWNDLDIWRGRPVSLKTPAKEIGGIACGVTETGSLQLEVGGVLQVFNGGELSLRLAE